MVSKLEKPFQAYDPISVSRALSTTSRPLMSRHVVVATRSAECTCRRVLTSREGHEVYTATSICVRVVKHRANLEKHIS